MPLVVSNIPITITLNGFNLVHACAHFGRTEITTWLYIHARDDWEGLVNAHSTRKTSEKATAAHIAVSRGFTSLADLLIGPFGCPTVDGSGVTLDVLALASSHQYVRDWGKRKTAPLLLCKDVEKLKKEVAKGSYHAAKRHIRASNCLHIGRWGDADIHTSTDPLDNGMSYRDIATTTPTEQCPSESTTQNIEIYSQNRSRQLLLLLICPQPNILKIPIQCTMQ